MELFREDGHLTDEGLAAVISGELDEMSRLEASEHLGFCEMCLERYTALLTDDILLSPKRPLTMPVLRRLRQGAKRRVWARYGTAAAAAGLALVLFGAGSWLVRDLPQRQSQPADTAPGWGERLSDGVANVIDNTGAFLNNLIPKGSDDADTQGKADDTPANDMNTPQPVAPPEGYKLTANSPLTPEQREALFDQQDRDDRPEPNK